VEAVVTHEQSLLLGLIDANVETLLKKASLHEKRLSEVERKQWFLAGAAGVVAFVAGKIGVGGINLGG
jgi:hypothetical protein